MSYTRCEDPILVGGCGSTGTTLLSVMLDAHPEVLCGPELALFGHPLFWEQHDAQWRDPLLKYLHAGPAAVSSREWTLANGFCPYAPLFYEKTLAWYGLTVDRLGVLIRDSSSGKDLADAIFRPLLERAGKPRWAERSPQDLYAFKSFLEADPRGRIVYMVRNAQDTIASLLRKRWGSFKRCVAFWLVDTAICETFRDHPRAHRVRYEDLVTNPRETISSLCAFLEISPEIDTMVDFHHSSRSTSPDASSVGQPTWHRRPTEPIGKEAIGAGNVVLTAEHRACASAASIASAVATYPQISGCSVDALLQQLDYDPLDTTGVNHVVLAELISAEGFFLSGEDYGQRGPNKKKRALHETHVECEPSRLPEGRIDWREQRLLAKIEQLRDELRRLESKVQSQKQRKKRTA